MTLPRYMSSVRTLVISSSCPSMAFLQHTTSQLGNSFLNPASSSLKVSVLVCPTAAQLGRCFFMNSEQKWPR